MLLFCLCSVPGSQEFYDATEAIKVALFQSVVPAPTDIIVVGGGSRRRLVEIPGEVDISGEDQSRPRSLLQASAYKPIRFIMLYDDPAAAVQGATQTAVVTTGNAFKVHNPYA